MGFQSRDHELSEPLSHGVFRSVDFLDGQIWLFYKEVDQIVEIEVGAYLSVGLPLETVFHDVHEAGRIV